MDRQKQTDRGERGGDKWIDRNRPIEGRGGGRQMDRQKQTDRGERGGDKWIDRNRPIEGRGGETNG